MTIFFGYLETDRTNVCWVEEGCSSLKPPTCSSAFLDVVDHVNKFDSDELNLHLNKGCYTGSAKLDAELNNAPASCNPPCFRIMLPGEYLSLIHISEPTRRVVISYAVFCLKKNLFLGLLQPHKHKNSEDLATLIRI